MSHLISSPLHSVSSCHFSCQFFLFFNLSGNLTDRQSRFSRTYSEIISSKSSSSLEQLHALCSKSGLRFFENYIQSCNLQTTRTILLPETVYRCACISLPYCYDYMCGLMALLLCTNSSPIFFCAQPLEKKKELFCLSDCGIKLPFLFFCQDMQEMRLIMIC